MDRISIRLPEDTLTDLEAYADANDLKRSPAARELIQSALADERGPDADDRVARVRAEHEREIEELETERDRVQRSMQQLLDQRDEHTDLVTAVERDATLAEQRADAGALTRLRWWAVGRREDER